MAFLCIFFFALSQFIARNSHTKQIIQTNSPPITNIIVIRIANCTQRAVFTLSYELDSEYMEAAYVINELWPFYEVVELAVALQLPVVVVYVHRLSSFSRHSRRSGYGLAPTSTDSNREARRTCQQLVTYRAIMSDMPSGLSPSLEDAKRSLVSRGGFKTPTYFYLTSQRKQVCT